MKAILLLAATAAVAVVAWIFIAPSGAHQVLRLRDEKRVLDMEIRDAQARNVRTAGEVKLLQSPEGKALLEKKAREELGYVGKDEVVLHMGAPRAAPAATPTTTATATPAAHE